ncbi:MAG: UV DNA damage repair endonuclease UvsE [Candidatus Methanomethylicaceae archaeon]
MRIGLGFFCSTSDNKLSTNHGIKVRNINEERLLRVFKRNVRDLIKLSRSMNLKIFRLGSGFIPLATHPQFKQDWFNVIEKILRELAYTVRSYGIRITMHPGQYVVLNSPKENIINKSLAELKYHFWILDTFNLGEESVVVTHVGGVYGDKAKAVKRLESTLENNRWVMRRLALENDEKFYSTSEVIEIAESFNIPVVFDYYHYILNPSNFDLDRLLSTWRNIIPEIHLSSIPLRLHRFGEHGDYVDIKDFKKLISLFDEEQVIDIIVEAKKKEMAIAKLLEEIRKEGIKLFLRE